MTLAPRHRLFFAIRPPEGPLPEIVALRDRNGTGRGRVEDHRLHVTTWLFPDHDVLPSGLAKRAMRAVDDMTLRAFHVVFDRVAGDATGLRLVANEPIRGYAAFQHDLAAAMTRAGLSPRPGWRFSPHMTLRYGGRQHVDEEVLGIGWRAEELVLIDSVLGAHRHETVARWDLRLSGL